ncbi:MAG: tetratricopeptide repeat protein [Actinobacteria bacterium]|nr:MAG: tetratricopeptide repeat protein [Actinomycetota bacterium]
MDAAAGPLVRARHDLARGRPDRALAALEQVTGAELESEEFWALRAAALFDAGDARAAVEAAQKGLVHDPADFALLDILALAQLASGRKKDARATIDSALLLYPDSAELQAHRALILARCAQRPFRLTSYRKARAAADEAVRLDPDSETALRVRAKIAAMSGDARAEVYAAELLERDPESEYAHVITGAARANRGNVRAGLEHFLEAARMDPSDPQLAWLGRRSRALQRWYAQPLLFLERVTHGHVRVGWVVIVLVTRSAHLALLNAAAIAFWIYMWVVHIHIRRSTGKAPS